MEHEGYPDVLSGGYGAGKNCADAHQHDYGRTSDSATVRTCNGRRNGKKRTRHARVPTRISARSGKPHHPGDRRRYDQSSIRDAQMQRPQEHFLYTTLNEIDQFDALKGQGNQQFKLCALPLILGTHTARPAGTSSITERITIRFNWNASTTVQLGQRYFSKVLTDGPISRINFCTIPEREIGAEMPVYGEYDDAFQRGAQTVHRESVQGVG